MNKRLLVVSVVILAMIAGSVTYLMILAPAPASEEAMPTERTSTTQPSEPTGSSSAGRYVGYSEETVAETTGTKVLFFHAPWCPQCRALEASIESGSIPEGVTIFKVDYDSNQALRQKYGVTIQTTLVRIDERGNLEEKYVAYDEPSLKAVTENLLR